ALCDFAAVWWFAVRLHRSARPTPRWLVRAPVASAMITAPMLIGYFAITPADLRFGEQAQSWWIGYAVTWTIYAALTAVGALTLLCLGARTIESTALRVSVLLMAAGTAAELPYLITRNIRWFTHTPPSMPAWSFGFSFARFALVALGACLAATWPMLRGIGDHLRYRRLTPLWTLLTAATPELRVCPPAPARLADVAAADLGWELLHQRMIDIHDSLLALHARATAELVDRAHTYAHTRTRARRRTATALGYLTAHVLTETPGPPPTQHRPRHCRPAIRSPPPNSSPSNEPCSASAETSALSRHQCPRQSPRPEHALRTRHRRTSEHHAATPAPTSDKPVNTTVRNPLHDRHYTIDVTSCGRARSTPTEPLPR
ncbi:DUF6545 domain-containing protein, partial [Rhodococcus erythropolis]|uniref:DUF6545 domain-containing protein n=1 Tax=Rhodococcus erythropolis TaxID=1833 RepID=UPI002949A969